MKVTIANETYYNGTEQMTGKLYSKVTQVNFLNVDNNIVVYNEIGVIKTENVEGLGEITSHSPIVNRPLKYTQEEMKALIDATGINFNAGLTNLLIDEINAFVDAIITNHITNNPQNYFGLTIDKWENG